MLRAAHTLKSTASSFGASRLSQLCRDLEALARDGDLATARTLVPATEEALRQLRGELGRMPGMTHDGGTPAPG